MENNTEKEYEAPSLEVQKKASKLGFISHLTTEGKSEEEVKVKLAKYDELLDQRIDRYNTLRAAVLEGFKG